MRQANWCGCSGCKSRRKERSTTTFTASRAPDIVRCQAKRRKHPPKTAGVFSLILSSGWLGAERSACDLAYPALSTMAASSADGEGIVDRLGSIIGRSPGA